MTYTKEDAKRIPQEHEKFLEWVEERIRVLIDLGIHDVNYVEYYETQDMFSISWNTRYDSDHIVIDWAELADETNATFLAAQAERDKVAAELAENRGIKLAERELEAAKRAYEDAIAKVESMRPLQAKED